MGDVVWVDGGVVSRFELSVSVTGYEVLRIQITHIKAQTKGSVFWLGSSNGRLAMFGICKILELFQWRDWFLIGCLWLWFFNQNAFLGETGLAKCIDWTSDSSQFTHQDSVSVCVLEGTCLTHFALLSDQYLGTLEFRRLLLASESKWCDCPRIFADDSFLFISVLLPIFMCFLALGLYRKIVISFLLGLLNYPCKRLSKLVHHQLLRNRLWHRFVLRLFALKLLDGRLLIEFCFCQVERSPVSFSVSDIQLAFFKIDRTLFDACPLVLYCV